MDKPQTAGFTYADGFLAEPVEHVPAQTSMEQDEEEQESDDDAKSTKRGRVEDDDEAQAEGNTFFEPFSPLIR